MANTWLSHVWLFANPWTAARQASLSITKSQSLPKLMSIELVLPSNHLILCLPFSSWPRSLPASGCFPMSQLFAWGSQSFGVSASASVLPMNTQDWSPLGCGMLLLLLSRSSRFQLCATPETAAHQAPLSLGFSRQEHWSGLPFPSPMHESEKWVKSLSSVWLLATPWTAAYQAPPPMGFPTQEYWSGTQLPSPGNNLKCP